MNQPTKLILRWDIQPLTESEYFEFMVSEFIPTTNKLGLSDIQAWYTLYGDCEQILFSAVANSEDQMQKILKTEIWSNVESRLLDLVTNFQLKVIRNVKGGFQL